MAHNAFTAGATEPHAQFAGRGEVAEGQHVFWRLDGSHESRQRVADRCRVEGEVDRSTRECPHSLGHALAVTGDVDAGGAQGVGVGLTSGRQ